MNDRSQLAISATDPTETDLVLTVLLGSEKLLIDLFSISPIEIENLSYNAKRTSVRSSRKYEETGQNVPHLYFALTSANSFLISARKAPLKSSLLIFLPHFSLLSYILQFPATSSNELTPGSGHEKKL